MTERIATAEWADPALVEEKYLYRDGTVWLGRSASEQPVPVGYTDDRHVCLVSGSRGGKGATSIVNNLIMWPGSLCVVDPKGENATITASRRGEGSRHCTGLGQAVQILDPFKTAQVDDSLRGRFNPLDALDPGNDETIDEAGRIADAVIVVHEASSDPFWDESARAMVKGLILHVLTAPEYKDRRNLITVRKLIMRGDWEAVEALREAGETDIPPAHGLLWTGLANNPSFDGLVAGIGDSFTNMLLNSPKQFESVLQVANRNTEFIDSPAMQRCLEASDFQISELKTRPGGLSVYLCLPQRYMSTHFRWLRMMIALTVTEMEKVGGRPATGYPILMVLDEFAGLKRMDVIENAVAQIAGYGVKLFFVLQSLEQLKAVYKDNWETFLANSGLKVFFNLEDHFSREYVSKLIGETELIREVRSASDSQSESESVSKSVTHSRSETIGRSSSAGTSESDGTNSSVSTGRSWGVNSSQSRSLNYTYAQGMIFRHYNWKSIGDSRSQSQGTSKGWTKGESKGVSHGTSRSHTDGTSESTTTGVSETEGTTRGTSQSRTEGTSETIQKRALITPDEIGQVFARIDDRGHQAYPGLALAIISGARPVAVRRVNYYEDYQFLKMFDPHPDHPYIAPKELAVEGRSAGVRLSDVGLGLVGWSIRQGQIVAVNQPAVAVGPPNGAAEAYVRVPHAGVVNHICQDRPNGDIPEGTLFSLWHYEDGSERIDPFAELRALYEKMRAQLSEKLRTRDVAPKPFLQRPVVLGLGALVLVAIVIAMIANSGHQKNTGANNSYAPAPIITPEKKSSADSPAPVITPENGSSTESNAPGAVTDADQPTIPPGPIMIGNVDVSHFAGVEPGDTPERVAAHFGRPTADDGNRKIYLEWLTVDFENGGAKAVHLNYYGWNRVYARLGHVNDDVMTLLSYSEARVIERLGEPQRRENGDGGLLVWWSFADGRSEPGWLQFKYGEGPNTSPDTISVTW
jgi:type IV secretory pathway TraG/TraD family ATPase VirD4